MTIDREATAPEFLVDPIWVQGHQNEPHAVLVDIDGEAGYQRGHIPGAVMLPSNYERDPGTGLVSTFPPDRFAAACRDLGIGDDTQVVVYDNNLSLHAARFWWVLNYYGHTNVKVLDGGWRRWVAEGRPVSFEPSAPDIGKKFTPRTDNSLLGTLDQVRAACAVAGSVIWDVRTNGEYDGTVSRRGLRPGHIPGAVNLEWSELMDRETHRFRPIAEIREMLNERGITPDKAVFAY
jgi:thiosulfate/3-mercaptopyruvate sulfurtransferase